MVGWWTKSTDELSYLQSAIRSLEVISLLSMQKKLAKDIFTLKKDGAKRHQQIFNFQSSIFNSGVSGLGMLHKNCSMRNMKNCLGLGLHESNN